MLVFTNRQLASQPDPSAYGRSFTPGATRLAVARVLPAGAGGFTVSDHRADVADADALNLLLPLFTADRPVCVYVHGNNNTPATCMTRCSALAALYGVEVIGFSWAAEGFLSDGGALPGVTAKPSALEEADLVGVSAANRTDSGAQQKIRRYHQAKTNAQDSVDAFARFLRLLGTARLHANVQPFTLAAHSLGSHLLQNTLEVPGAAESVGTAFNVVLLAPCVRAAGHAAWLTKFRPKGRTYVTFNRGDNVLFGAFAADGGQIKLGADPGDELVRTSAVRYVSFTNSMVGVGGHRYFVQDRMPRAAKELFRRILGSAPDLAAGEGPRRVYPVGCDADGAVCFMAAPDDSDIA